MAGKVLACLGGSSARVTLQMLHMHIIYIFASCRISSPSSFFYNSGLNSSYHRKLGAHQGRFYKVTLFIKVSILLNLRVVEADFELISKAFKNQLIIPEFPTFCATLRDIYEECKVRL